MNIQLISQNFHSKARGGAEEDVNGRVVFLTIGWRFSIRASTRWGFCWGTPHGQRKGPLPCGRRCQEVREGAPAREGGISFSASLMWARLSTNSRQFSACVTHAWVTVEAVLGCVGRFCDTSESCVRWQKCRQGHGEPPDFQRLRFEYQIPISA